MLSRHSRRRGACRRSNRGFDAGGRRFLRHRFFRREEEKETGAKEAGASDAVGAYGARAGMDRLPAGRSVLRPQRTPVSAAARPLLPGRSRLWPLGKLRYRLLIRAGTPCAVSRGIGRRPSRRLMRSHFQTRTISDTPPFLKATPFLKAKSRPVGPAFCCVDPRVAVSAASSSAGPSRNSRTSNSSPSRRRRARSSSPWRRTPRAASARVR